MLTATIHAPAIDFAAFPLFSIVEGVPDVAARAALDLLEQAPRLSASELAAWLGITEFQADACRHAQRGLW